MPDDQPDPADTIEHWPIERLIERDANPRVHSEEKIARLAASMDHWGVTSAILIDEDGRLLAGHARLAAARKLRLTHMPVMVARGWSEEKKRGKVVADNQLALSGSEWEPDILRDELFALDNEGFPLALLGFSDLEIESFLSEPIGEVSSQPGAFKAQDEEPQHRCPTCGHPYTPTQR